MTYERITAYLLEELTEQDSEQFEEQCFAQDEWPAEIDAVEQDLIDAYLRNELTSKRRRLFEERYLTTEARKARVLAAKTIHQVLCLEPLPKVTLREKLQAFWQRPLVPQTALAVLVLAVGIGIVGRQLFSPRTPQTFTEIELAMSTSERATGAQRKTVSLPLSADALKINLKLPEPSSDTAGYRVQLEHVNGSLRELKIEQLDAQSVVVIIPAAELIRGQYHLKLLNKNDAIGNYYFTAEDAPTR